MPVPQPPRSTRRELLKMLPVAGAAVLLQPTWRSRVIERGLALNDVISERTFDPRLAAPTYADSEVTPFDRFPLNSYLADDPDIDLDEWRLEISGLVARPGRYSVRDLRALPRVRQNTRHICIEGWDVIGSFGGIRLGDVLTLVGADQRARFVEVRCGDDVRVCHWTFALSLLVLIGSGLEVFAAFPSFGEKLPASDLPVPPSILRIGGWLGGALQWHFTFAWLLATAMVIYFTYQGVSGNARQVLFARRDARSVWPMVRHYVLFGPKPANRETYNPLQKLAYTIALLLIAVSLVTGFALYKPVQLWWLVYALGGFRLTRVWHFAAMCGLLAFIPGHLVMVALHGWGNFASMWTGVGDTRRAGLAFPDPPSAGSIEQDPAYE